MKKTKIISCLLAVTLIAASFAGCGDTAASASADKTTQNQEQQQTQDSRGTMAKVVSLEGDQITVLLADMPTDKGGSAPPSNETGTTDSAVQTDGNTPPSAPPDGGGQKGDVGPQGGTQPDGQNGATPPAISSDGSGQPDQSGKGGRQIQFASAQTTYTLSSDVKVTQGMGDNATEIDLSKIAADSVISFTTTTDSDGNEVISSIRVME